MAGIDPAVVCGMSPGEQLAHQFYDWEVRGRGWLLQDRPVEPEPPFKPFFCHTISESAPIDDGRTHTILSGAIDWLQKKILGHAEPPIAIAEPQIWESQPRECDVPDGLVELQVSIPSDLEVTREAAEQFLLCVSGIRVPLAFEIIGSADAVTVQFVCDEQSVDHVEQQLRATFPEVTITTRSGFLEEKWHDVEDAETVIAEFGLAREFMLPLAMSRSFAVDPLTGIIAALADVHEGEVAAIQILFQAVRHPWAESVLRSVSFSDGSPFFDGLGDLLGQAQQKVSRPLYGTVVRVCCRTSDQDGSWNLAKRLTSALGPLADPEGNDLIPLDNEGYPQEEHEQDVLWRQSRRCGMILSSEELVSLVHLPSASVRECKLRGSTKKSRAAPSLVHGHRLVLGNNEHAGTIQTVTLSPEQRTKHMHVIGASGTGKSTLLLNMIIQDIKNGDGVAVLDPHGDLIDAILQHIPQERVDDVVLFDPADEEYPVGFNILSAHSELEKNLLASDLVAVFRRLSTSWGDQMNAVLGNAIIAFLESSRGGTLVDLRRFLVEPGFRKEFLATVEDPDVVYYWLKEFQLLSGRPQGPVLTRLDTFLRPKIVRYMVGQKNSRLDFADVMDSGKIFLARLSHGAIGEENAHLLGALLVSKFHQVAMGRQRLAEADRRYFWLYVDEFQNFATPSMAAILSGARKYRLGLILAHQELHQLASKAPEVASAVAANPYTRVCFRLGDEDAKKLAGGFVSFEAIDLQNLPTGEAICRVERAELDFNLRTSTLPQVDEQVAAGVRQKAIALSRQKYAVPRADAEAELQRARGESDLTAKEPTSRQAKTTKESPVEDVTAIPPPVIVATQPAPSGKRPPKPISPDPAPLGRGGPEHKYLQALIKQYAEGMGYKAGIEENILGGRGIDVALAKGNTSIACEICITTDDDHEFGNVQKCLEAGYKHVAVISPNASRLRSLQKTIGSQLADAERQRVRFFAPEELMQFIQELEVEQLGTEKMVRGYKIKTSFKALDHDDSRGRREVVSSVVAKAMKRLQDKAKQV